MTTVQRAQNAALLHFSIGPVQCKNLLLATLLFGFETSSLLAVAFHGSSSGTRAIHGKFPHNDGLLQLKSTRGRFELAALAVEAAVPHQPSRQRTDRLPRRWV